jgi:hypothetical protein
MTTLPCVIAAFTLVVATVPAQQASAPSTWVLDSSTLTHHMSHPIHEVDCRSKAAKGKGFCHEGTCAFLLTIPVKSFDSGDTNRDLHMLQATRGAQFPMVTVRFRVPQDKLADPMLVCDLEVQFAGQTRQYAKVVFKQSFERNNRHFIDSIPSTLTDFKNQPQSFLMVPIKMIFQSK